MLDLLYCEDSVKSLNEGIRPHQHDFWQLDLTRLGRFETMVNGNLYSTTRGDLLFIPPGHSHELLCKTNRGEALIVKFAQTTTEPRICLLTQTPEREAIASALVGIVKAWQTDGQAPLKRQIELLLQTLLVEAFERRHSPRARRRDLRARIDTYLDRRQGGYVTVAEVARHLGYSVSHTSRLFRRQEGVSLKDHLDRHRADLARTMLRFSELTVGEIADQMEFPNLSAFSRFIRQRLGHSPRELRQQP